LVEGERVTQGARTRWWRRGRDEALAHARTASSAAAAAFVALDALQSHTALRVEAYAALERGRVAQRAGEEWAGLQRDAEAATTGYLRVTEQYDAEADLPERDARAAQSAYGQAERELSRVQAAMRDFATRNDAEFVRMEAALERLAAAGQDADASIAAARDAIAAAERAGTPAHDATDALHAAEQARTVLSAGAPVHGLRAAVAAADTVRTEAARARALAESLPAMQSEVRRAVTAVRTRIEAVATRRERLADTLSALRRGFVAKSYADLEGNPELADKELLTAGNQLDTAERELASHHLPRAREALAAARQALDAASTAVDAVTRRHTVLLELKRDPAAGVQRTRFVVREAQRLFVFLGDRADQRFAPQLDSLVRRVAVAEEAFAAPHPDYWGLDRDLARIRDETAEVVRRLRGI
jgi:hypothetical protein